MKKKEPLIPAATRWIPTPESRAICKKIISAYPPERFEKYTDYFVFVHFDPVQRFWHWVGMLIGTSSFVALAFHWNRFPQNLIYYVLGVFFFYGFGVLSHTAYDDGTGKTQPRRFLETFPTVIHFNVLTLLGRYPVFLEKFIEKYPFAIEAWDLIPLSEYRRRRNLK